MILKLRNFITSDCYDVKKDKYLKYMETVARENDGSVNIKFYPEIEK